MQSPPRKNIPEPRKERLILFSRYPAPGRAKTRLIPALGPKGAADIQRRMTETVLTELLELRHTRPLSFEIRYTGGEATAFRKWLKAATRYEPQGRGNLGARLCRAFDNAFAEGAERAVAVGADCPSLSRLLAAEAFDKLKRHDLVLGPAMDGGYYLIGLAQPRAVLFQDISWGTEAVLAQTLTTARALGLSCFLLEPLADVDRPEDLRHLHYHSGAQ